MFTVDPFPHPPHGSKVHDCSLFSRERSMSVVDISKCGVVFDGNKAGALVSTLPWFGRVVWLHPHACSSLSATDDIIILMRRGLDEDATSTLEGHSWYFSPRYTSVSDVGDCPVLCLSPRRFNNVSRSKHANYIAGHCSDGSCLAIRSLLRDMESLPARSSGRHWLEKRSTPRTGRVHKHWSRAMMRAR